MRSRVTRRPTSEVGFTLVELLVVIGIIAVLIGILLPTLNRARISATRVQCLSNQKQILLAILMYVNESKGILPGPIVPSTCDSRISNAVPGTGLQDTNGNPESQMTAWATAAGGVDYSRKELSYIGLLQKFIGGPTAYKVWECPGSTDKWDVAPAASGSYGGKVLGYGYLMNSTSQTASTTPSFLFGYYGTYTNPTAAQVYSTQPKRVNQIQNVYGPSGAQGFDYNSSHIWLMTDIDSRNWNTNYSASFGMETYLGSTYQELASYKWQPAHSNGTHQSANQRSSLGRNYGYLDGHAQYLSYYDWPNNGVAEQ